MVAFKKNLWYKRQNLLPVRKAPLALLTLKYLTDCGSRGSIEIFTLFHMGNFTRCESLLTGFTQLNPWKPKPKKIFFDLFLQWMKC